MDIAYKNNYRTVLDEIAVYEVKDGKIVLNNISLRARSKCFLRQDP